MQEMKISVLAQIVNLLPRLSSEETSQLLAIIRTRAGGETPSRPSSGAPRRSDTKTRDRGVPRMSRKPRKKGNPSRKSQWVTNPLYQEYHRLKKVVEVQAKTQKLSFNLVSSTEKTAYDAAFAAWMEEKRSFRSSGNAPTTEQGSKVEQDQEETPKGGPSNTGITGSRYGQETDMVCDQAYIPGTPWGEAEGEIQTMFASSSLPTKRSFIEGPGVRTQGKATRSNIKGRTNPSSKC